MKVHLVMPLVIYVLTTLLYSQEFSVESMLNDYHVQGETDIEISKNWEWIHKYVEPILLKKYYQFIEKERKYSNEIFTYTLPDSIADRIFRIKKGDIVTQFYAGSIVGSDTIKVIEASLHGSGTILFHFLLNNLDNRHKDWYDPISYKKNTNYYFYVINSNDVKSKNLSQSDIELSDSLLNNITQILNVEMENSGLLEAYFKLNTQIEELDTIKYRLKRYCSYEIYEVDIDQNSQADIFIEFISQDPYKAISWNFALIFYSSRDEYELRPFSFFEYAINVEGKSYYMFRGYLPETGGRGRNLYIYDLETKKLQRIFGDWTFSD